MANNNGTPFSIIYDSFLSKVTDDMYMELTEVETFELLQELLLSAIPHFEFPRVIRAFQDSTKHPPQLCTGPIPGRAHHRWVSVNIQCRKCDQLPCQLVGNK